MYLLNIYFTILYYSSTFSGQKRLFLLKVKTNVHSLNKVFEVKTLEHYTTSHKITTKLNQQMCATVNKCTKYVIYSTKTESIYHFISVKTLYPTSQGKWSVIS